MSKNWIIDIIQQFLESFAGASYRIELFVLDNNTWKHLHADKLNQADFKKEITYKLFTDKSYLYNHLTMWKQMTDVKLNCLCCVTVLQTILLCENKWPRLD